MTTRNRAWATAGILFFVLIAAAAISCGRAPEAAEAGSRDLNPFVVSATASSVQNYRHPAECAFDGDATTRWSSEFRDGEWIEARFDRSVILDTAVIVWEAARAARYVLEVRDESGAWIEAARIMDGRADALVDTLAIASPRPAVAVRVRTDSRATGWGNSIFELRLFGRAEGEPPARSLVGWRRPLTGIEQREVSAAERLLAEAAADPPASRGMSDDAFLDLVSRRAFDYFWWESDPGTGLTRDRAWNFHAGDDREASSIAATGFALTALVVGAERGWVPRAEARERAMRTIRSFADGTVRNVRGFFPHFVNMRTGKDEGGTEVSTIDTVLFLCGMITAAEYFGDTEIAGLSRRVFERVDWEWARNGKTHVSMGLEADGKFITYTWGSIADEGTLLYLLALGSPTHPLAPSAWDSLERDLGEFAGHRFIASKHVYQSIFRYQYPLIWFDLRGRVDRHGVDYPLNATLATLAMRDYCIEQAARFPGSFGPDLWGQGAADGLENRYIGYGFPPGNPPADGTVVVYALGGSIPFLPRHAIRGLRALYDRQRETWGRYGFTDAVNVGADFRTRDVIGLDQGTLLLSIENHRSGLIWRTFMKNAWVRAAMSRVPWRGAEDVEGPGAPVDLARLDWTFRAGRNADPPPAGSGVPVLVPDRLRAAHADLKDFRGAGWYEVVVPLEAERIARWIASGRGTWLWMGGVSGGDLVLVNGTRVGETPESAEGSVSARIHRVPAGLLKEGSNRVSIRLSSAGGTGGIISAPVRLGPAPPRPPLALVDPRIPMPAEWMSSFRSVPIWSAGKPLPPPDRAGVWEAEGAVVSVEPASSGAAHTGLRIAYDVTRPGAFGGWWIKPAAPVNARVAGIVISARGDGAFSPDVPLDVKATGPSGIVTEGTTLRGLEAAPRRFFVPIGSFPSIAARNLPLRECTVFWDGRVAVKKGAIVIEGLELLLAD